MGLEPTLQEMIVVELADSGRFEMADEKNDHHAHLNGFFFAIDQAAVVPVSAPASRETYGSGVHLGAPERPRNP